MRVPAWILVPVALILPFLLGYVLGAAPPNQPDGPGAEAGASWERVSERLRGIEDTLASHTLVQAGAENPQLQREFQALRHGLQEQIDTLSSRLEGLGEKPRLPVESVTWNEEEHTANRVEFAQFALRDTPAAQDSVLLLSYLDILNRFGAPKWVRDDGRGVRWQYGGDGYYFGFDFLGGYVHKLGWGEK